MRAASAACLLALAACRSAPASRAPAELDRHDVVWTTPSADAAGSMPLGNGEVGVNLWVEESGDVCLLLARTDAFSEASRLLKLGRVRVRLDPSPLADGAPFRQTLRLRAGRVDIECGDARLTVLVDSERPVVRVLGESATPRRVTATLEVWREGRRELLGSGPYAERTSSWTMRQGGDGGDTDVRVFESGDVVASAPDAVVWYHRNEESVVPFTLAHQGLAAEAGLVADPLLHRTFGGRIAARDGFTAHGRTLASDGPRASFELAIATHSAVAPSADAWRTELEELARAAPPGAVARAETARWWADFWARAWVLDPGGEPSALARAWVLQRWMQACGGRGRYPIKFNGSIFTVEPRHAGAPDLDPDWRRWGDCHWWQNLRLAYHPMLACGDFELMEPLWRLYADALPLAEARARRMHGAAGAYFPETMTVFGTYSNGDYGWQRAGRAPSEVLCPWWDDAWNQGLELVDLMLDRYDYTGDAAFLRERVLPMAESVLRWFDSRFARDAAGKLVIEPTQALETYWSGVVNDMPCVAGLTRVTRRLAALPADAVDPDRRALFERMAGAVPAVPTHVVERDGRPVRALAPAERFDPARSNCESPELYAVFPFRLVGPGSPDLEAARAAFALRHDRFSAGWPQDGIVAALLGLTEEAAADADARASASHPAYRWPATWGPNFDWLPDQTHGGNLMSVVQLMLLACAGDEIRLLPAWPRERDVRFRLAAPHRTTVECELVGGRIVRLVVDPPERMRDVVLPAWE